MIVQTFYDGVAQPMQFTMDAAIGGPLMNKREEEART